MEGVWTRREKVTAWSAACRAAIGADCSAVAFKPQRLESPFNRRRCFRCWRARLHRCLRRHRHLSHTLAFALGLHLPRPWCILLLCTDARLFSPRYAPGALRVVRLAHPVASCHPVWALLGSGLAGAAALARLARLTRPVEHPVAGSRCLPNSTQFRLPANRRPPPTSRRLPAESPLM